MMMSKETTGCRNQFSSEVGAALHLQLQIDTAAHPCAPTERKNVRIAYLFTTQLDLFRTIKSKPDAALEVTSRAVIRSNNIYANSVTKRLTLLLVRRSVV